MGMKKYTKEVVKEGKRVRWPKREKLTEMVTTVIVIVAIAVLFLMLADMGAGYLLGGIEKAFGAL